MAIWIDLWGFVSRYDQYSLSFVHGHQEKDELTAWISRTGLELFPRHQGFLLRSLAPVYAVRDREPRVFSLEPTAPRPTLRIGRELDRESGFRVLEVADGTYVRWQVTEPGQPPTDFGSAHAAGTRIRLGSGVERRVVWLALEQQRDGEGRQAGWVLSWDAVRGWRFRGFFARRGAVVELGTVRQGGEFRRILMGDEACQRQRAFRLTIDGDGDHWSESTPASVQRQMTPAMIREWEMCYFAPDRCPAALRGYGIRVLQQPTAEESWIFEFFEYEAKADLDSAPGIRVWGLQDEVSEELLGPSVKDLGEDVAGEEQPDSLDRPADSADSEGAESSTGDEIATGQQLTESPPPAAEELPAEESPTGSTAPSEEPFKKILRADDDDDDF